MAMAFFCFGLDATLFERDCRYFLGLKEGLLGQEVGVLLELKALLCLRLDVPGCGDGRYLEG